MRRGALDRQHIGMTVRNEPPVVWKFAFDESGDQRNDFVTLTENPVELIKSYLTLTKSDLGTTMWRSEGSVENSLEITHIHP
jgi:hypothetical protein